MGTFILPHSTLHSFLKDFLAPIKVPVTLEGTKFGEASGRASKTNKIQIFFCQVANSKVNIFVFIINSVIEKVMLQVYVLA